MIKNRLIQVRVTRSQYERILSNAQAKGNKTISEFVRRSVLGMDTLIEKKIHIIYEAVVEKKEEPGCGEDYCLLKFIEV
ncbi:MAG: hypothetical protein V1735_07240 [Nanoarchaeota archaeon]